jgi:hypothetical protein
VPRPPGPANGRTREDLKQLPADELLRLYRQVLGSTAGPSPAARQERDRLAQLQFNP